MGGLVMPSGAATVPDTIVSSSLGGRAGVRCAARVVGPAPDVALAAADPSMIRARRRPADVVVDDGDVELRLGGQLRRGRWPAAAPLRGVLGAPARPAGAPARPSSAGPGTRSCASRHGGPHLARALQVDLEQHAGVPAARASSTGRRGVPVAVAAVDDGPLQQLAAGDHASNRRRRRSGSGRRPPRPGGAAGWWPRPTATPAGSARARRRRPCPCRRRSARPGRSAAAASSGRRRAGFAAAQPAALRAQRSKRSTSAAIWLAPRPRTPAGLGDPDLLHDLLGADLADARQGLQQGGDLHLADDVVRLRPRSITSARDTLRVLQAVLHLGALPAGGRGLLQGGGALLGCQVAAGARTGHLMSGRGTRSVSIT